ncbi:MAG: hypothetical protein KGJ86_02555 [Chloroflexota bacterium]|nr:hypothetical protein [Chloroflexota bacterium]
MQAETLDPEAAVQAIEYCYEQGWSDGLPVVPPTPALMDQFLSHTGRNRPEVVWRMEHVNRACTVELAAANAVMAGCRPEYFPVVLAALEAVVDEGSAGIGAWQSTTGGTPLLVVNGPVRQQLGFNCAGSLFGSGFRANATVGRAIRLIIMNAFGVRPHVLDQATQATPGKYTLCIAENEEESPWEPLHVELGHSPQASTVSALHIRSCDFLDNRQTDDPVHILNDIVDTVSRTGIMRRRLNCTCVVMGPEHAQLLARHGYSKADVKAFIAEHAGRTYADLERVGKEAIEEPLGFCRPATEAEATQHRPDEFLRSVPSPKDVLLIVAGARNAGVSTVVQPFNTTHRRVPGIAVVEDVKP